MNANQARDTVTPTQIHWSGRTDRGTVRANNEDSFLGLRFDSKEVHHLGKLGTSSMDEMDFVFAVCDGMGGALAGEFASRIAIEKITTLLPRTFHQTSTGFDANYTEVLRELNAQIHRSLCFLGNSYSECHGMETTLSLCWLTPGWLYFSHIGDSRIYHLPKASGTLKQLSEDDTHVAWLLRNGKITEHEARTHPRRNVLQKALGGGHQFVDPQVGAVPYESGDIFLLCSDGLVDGLFEHRLIDLLRSDDSEAAPDSSASTLVEASLQQSGRDNTTALVVTVR
ncbi:MAG: serine/threonine-protein phosphatase [Pedosphaera sp.]|nr:serine/threonine-protein phosphatase [Pedosphaera sp.]